MNLIEWVEFKSFFLQKLTVVQWLLTISTLVLVLVLKSLIRKRLNLILLKYSYEQHRAVLTRRILFFGVYLGAIVALFAIWGANAKNIWIYLSSILGVMAIGFFATWSLLSNIVAGLLIYTSNPFKIGSTIKLFDPDITACVKDIHLIYTILEDDEGITQVPNNIFFQQSFKVINTQK